MYKLGKESNDGASGSGGFGVEGQVVSFQCGNKSCNFTGVRIAQGKRRQIVKPAVPPLKEHATSASKPNDTEKLS